jgi:hypothetical protein
VIAVNLQEKRKRKKRGFNSVEIQDETSCRKQTKIKFARINKEEDVTISGRISTRVYICKNEVCNPRGLLQGPSRFKKKKQCKRPQLEDDDKTGYIYALEEAKELVLTQ